MHVNFAYDILLNKRSAWSESDRKIENRNGIILRQNLAKRQHGTTQCEKSLWDRKETAVQKSTVGSSDSITATVMGTMTGTNTHDTLGT
jgi:hypothetical protein